MLLSHNVPVFAGHELSVKQFDEMVYLEECADNPEWWLVENAAGDKGFVPKSYMKVSLCQHTILGLNQLCTTVYFGFIFY